MIGLIIGSIICAILLCILYNQVETMLYKKRTIERTIDLMQYIKHKLTNSK